MITNSKMYYLKICGFFIHLYAKATVKMPHYWSRNSSTIFNLYQDMCKICK